MQGRKYVIFKNKIVEKMTMEKRPIAAIWDFPNFLGFWNCNSSGSIWIKS
jgi:hypothetical protein